MVSYSFPGSEIINTLWLGSIKVAELIAKYPYKGILILFFIKPNSKSFYSLLSSNTTFFSLLNF